MPGQTPFFGLWPGPADVDRSRLDRHVKRASVNVGRAGPLILAGGDARASTHSGQACFVVGRLSEAGSPTEPDVPERLAHAFRRAGPAMLSGLRGEFLIVLCRGPDGETVIARDQLGGRSLHWSTLGGGMSFAEEPRDLLPLLSHEPGPDPVSVASFAAHGVVPRGRSFYQSIHRLPPGHLLRFSGSAWSIERWWGPVWAGSVKAREEELPELIVAAMDRAVARCMGASKGVGVLLSGGLDSGCVASAAVRASPVGSEPVAYSGVFPEVAEADESALIEDVSSALGMASVRRTVRGGSPLLGALRYQREWLLPVASPNHFLWEPLLNRAATDGVKVMLDGEGGDELFDASGYLIAESLRHGRIRTAGRLIRRVVSSAPGEVPAGDLWRALARHGLKGAQPHVAHVLARRVRDPRRYTPQWMRRDAARAVVEGYDAWAWKQGPGPLWWRHQAWLLSEMREHLDAHGYLRRRCAQVGLEGRHPFFHDVDLVELALEIPALTRLGPLDRIRLRRGMQGRLPDSVRLRPSKTYFGGVLERGLEDQDGQIIRGLLGEDAAEIHSVVSRDALRQDVLGARPTGRTGQLLQQGALWRLGILEVWLRTFSDGDFPSRLAARREAEAPAQFE